MNISNLKLLIFKKPSLILVAILLIGLFFRTFKLDIFYSFEHDQDLSSWIVKDIWVDHHLRLIGQVTSIEGVFIGPLFYYLLTPFYVLAGMNPLSGAIMAVLIGLFTIWSIYFVFSKFFGKSAGIFGSAIYATSLGPVFFDRWAVPTLPTMLWCVWLLYTLFSLAEGKTKSLIIAAILIGTIWHIHVALLPLIPLIILSFFLSKQKITPQITILSLSILIFLTIPFWLFELKHNFLQTKSLLFTSNNTGLILKGLERFGKILSSTQKILTASLFDTWDLIPQFLAPVLTIVLFIFVFWKKLLSTKQIIILLCWVGLVILVQQITKNPISEYYLENITIIPILLTALLLRFFYQQKKWKYLALGLVAVYILINTYLLTTKPEPWHHYKFKQQTAEFIRQDANFHGYRCISVNYIAKYGTGVGFRYLIWWEGLHQIKQESGAPLYTIVVPYDAIPKDQLSAQFHYFGVILPKDSKPIVPQICNDPKNEPIPLLGFTN